MTQQQLEYFMELARSLNFTKVSKRFLISQTAVSKQIQSLEEELGVKLFNRTSRQVELTSAGKSLLRDVPQILDNLYDAVHRVQKASMGFTGDLRVGYSKGLERTGFHTKLFDFSAKYPNVSVSLFRMNDFNLYIGLDNLSLDVAFGLPYQSRNPAYDRFPLFSCPLVCVVHHSHPFASRSAVTLDDMAAERLLLMASNSSLPDASSIRLGPLPYFPNSFDPKFITWTSDMESAILMAAMQMGVAVVPFYMVEQPSPPEVLRIVPVEDVTVKNQIIFRKDNVNPALRKLLPFFDPEVQA